MYNLSSKHQVTVALSSLPNPMYEHAREAAGGENKTSSDNDNDKHGNSRLGEETAISVSENS